MDQKTAGLNITIFFCQQLDTDQDKNRRSLEKELGSRIRFFPLPCSGRIDPLHLLRALESGADMVYLITCPEGACRYREGNLRAWKRVRYARKLIEEIGLEGTRIELITGTAATPVTIDEVARELLAREAVVGVSPVRNSGKHGAESGEHGAESEEHGAESKE
ncbi:MAG: hydrogenase iron-sulfur subunit [Syntrophorhabdaceae bacterium]|nr:hydrogenase iron-sulfur subunit [Syntrophorhabdaceae bacterium]MDD5243767.1 hydrogenase iron-sulfur subunit [Syntrophorhabdaceae bacterium]